MYLLDKLRSKPAAGETATAEAPVETPTPVVGATPAEDPEIQRRTEPEIAAVDEKGDQAADEPDLKDIKEFPDLDAQLGVQKVEAVTLTWTKKTLACLLCL